MTASRRILVLVLLCALSIAARSQSAAKPVSKAELMAMVAGNVLEENVVHEIKSRGIGFRSDDKFKLQLSSAGAGRGTLAALNSSSTQSSTSSNGEAESSLLADLANAGRLLRAGQYDAATKELSTALQAGADVEAAFVMGEVLRRQERFDMAVAIYQRVLQEAPGFPEIHTKLAYVLYRVGDQEEALREARVATTGTPDNAEAHKNVGLALAALDRPDAAIAEYQEALRIKPDYAPVHYDLGLVFSSKHDSGAAIAEYKKTLALDPNNIDCRYNLGILLTESRDTRGAIRQYQEAKRQDPNRIEIRQNLGANLADVDPDAAVKEFRELTAMAPDFELGHIGLGLSLSRQGNLAGAETEYRLAAKIEPSDALPHSNLGSVLERQKKYDAAMAEFRRAAELDDTSAPAHAGMGRIFLLQKDYPSAIRELRAAEMINASLADVHSDLGEALAATGDLAGGIAEVKQAQLLDPAKAAIRSALAPMLERNGDFASALEQYRMALELGNTEKERSDYTAAQQRLKGKVGSPAADQASGTSQASSSAASSQSDPDAWRSTLDAGHQAMNERRLGDAEKLTKDAIASAEKIRPRDVRVLRSYSQLAMVYYAEGKLVEAKAEWQRYLSASQEIQGPESTETIHGMEGIAGCAYVLKDFASASTYYARAIALGEKVLPNSQQVVSDMYWLALSYQAQGAFDKAEPIFLQLHKLNSSQGSQGFYFQNDLLLLAKLYLAWGKLDKAEEYSRESLAEREQAFGHDNPMVADSLETLSDVLLRLGKPEEAAQIKKRHDAILPASQP